MKTRLGLDMGTNSIGWCLYEGDTIRDMGSEYSRMAAMQKPALVLLWIGAMHVRCDAEGIDIWGGAKHCCARLLTLD